MVLPLFDPAVKAILTWPSPAVADKLVGAAGGEETAAPSQVAPNPAAAAVVT